jgi:hypothetical protein
VHVNELDILCVLIDRQQVFGFNHH